MHSISAIGVAIGIADSAHDRDSVCCRVEHVEVSADAEETFPEIEKGCIRCRYSYK
jgi:hypothetical protein